MPNCRRVTSTGKSQRLKRKGNAMSKKVNSVIAKQHQFASGLPFYSPSWRFKTPDGVDDDGDADDAKAKADAAEAERQAELQKIKQRADQEAANARKAREQAEQYRSQHEQTQSELERLQEEVRDLRQKASNDGVELPTFNEEDYTDSDVPIIKAIKALDKNIEAKTAKIATLEEELAKERTEKAKQTAEQQKNAAYNEILSDLDAEYGVENRNDAIKEFNELLAEGKVPTTNPAKAVRVLEKCYKNAKKQRQKDIDDGKLPVDDGAGGGTPKISGANKLKPGSLNQVLQQLSKK